MAPVDRIAVSGGPADVCFDETGSQIIACGDDQDTRVFKGIEDMAPTSHLLERGRNHGFAIISKGSRYFIGSDANTVDVYTLENGEFESSIMQFTAAVTCLASVSLPQTTLIAAGAGDFKIIVANYDVETGIVTTRASFVGHAAPILSVALDPVGKYLASSSGDGTVKMWNISDNACVKTLDNFIPKINDYAAARQLGRMSFEPKTGNILAVPSVRDVKLFIRDKWEVVGVLNDSSCHAPPSVASFSPCGTHVAVGHNDGTILLYNTGSRQMVKSFRSGKLKSVWRIAWNPARNVAEFVFCDREGYISLVKEAFLPSENRENSTNNFSDGVTPEAKAPKSPTGKLDIDENSNKGSGHFNDNFEFDDDQIDIVSVSDFAAKKTKPAVPFIPRTKMQKHFQPGTTYGHRHRFLVWNDIGYMKTYVGEDSDSFPAIDIIFHNSSQHRPIHVTNMENFTLGTLNDTAYLLATEEPDRQEETDVRRKSSMVRLVMIGDGKQWTLPLNDDEWIRGIALGGNLCYLATSRRMVRMITHSGFQQYIVSFPGPFVSLAARANLVTVVYHQAEPFNDDQCLGHSLYQITTRGLDLIESDRRLPLSPKAELVWVGFGLRDTPCIVDNAGIVRVYQCSGPLAKIWSPCLDLRSRIKNKFDHYFIVALDEVSRQIRAIFCRGSSYPQTVPIPVQSVIPLETMQVDMTEDNNKKEADLTLRRLFPSFADQNSKISAEVLRLFATYSANSEERRAVDIMQALVPEVKDLAVFRKYALSACRKEFATLVEEIIEQMHRDEDADSIPRPPSPDLYGGTASATSTPAARTVTLSKSSTPKTTTLSHFKPAPSSRISNGSVNALSRFNKGETERKTQLFSDSEDEDAPVNRGSKMVGSDAEDAGDDDRGYDLQEDEADSLMGRPTAASSSDSNGESTMSSQTLMLEENHPHFRLSNGTAEKTAPDNMSSITSTPGNPFRKFGSERPEVMRGISSMEDLTKGTFLRKERYALGYEKWWQRKT
ncbi:WD repeat and HMG-box DNA-binding protein 1-like [Paramacrobiotus metropolitanus]|uniref:WD repeat and HMG-box DNA-binding protein 1-like n=1 Tax=Paramacrobiotus metropolitanus TaxID=2943436 RepID=UPI0024462503|nr:WD repeat and HMG-box DNA-binding protein 1-like [Paramacrobiotus metropolitanus]